MGGRSYPARHTEHHNRSQAASRRWTLHVNVARSGCSTATLGSCRRIHLIMRKTSRSALPSELLLDLLLVLFEKARGSGDLADAVGTLRGRDVPLATFYRQLQRAFDSGWVTIEEPDGATHTPGRPERLYRLTQLGEKALRSGLEMQRRRTSLATALGLMTEGGR